METAREVLVAIDGSASSRLALEWALDEAKNLGTVRTITAFSIAPVVDGFGMMPSAYSPDVFRDAAHARAMAVIESVDPSLAVNHTTAMGSAGPVLVDASQGADLLVVGTEGRSALLDRVMGTLGSVGSYAVKHASVPVAVIPETGKISGRLKRITVGVDGSSNAGSALRWALDHVEPDGIVVAAGTFYFDAGHAFAVAGTPESELIDRTTEVVRQAVEEVATPEEAERFVRIDVQAGDPRLVLRQLGESSDCLVLGKRGHRGVAHLFLGSVTTSLAHHPTCVTVVVPE